MPFQCPCQKGQTKDERSKSTPYGLSWQVLGPQQGRHHQSSKTAATKSAYTEITNSTTRLIINKQTTVKFLPNNLSIISVNFQSLRNKKQCLANLIDEANKPDIILGCETWLRPDHYSSEFIPAGYSVQNRKDRSDGYGGVLIVTKDGYLCEEVSTEYHPDCELTASLLTGKSKVLLVSVYRPPKNDIIKATDLCQCISSLVQKYKSYPIWVAGDFNLPDILWDRNSIEGHQYSKDFNQLFLDTFADAGLEQIIHFHTRGDNTLDLFFTNRPTLILDKRPLPGISDHHVIFVSSRIQSVCKRPVKRKIYLWHKANKNALNENMTSLANQLMSQKNLSVEQLWDKIKLSIQECLNTHVPSKLTSQRFNQPWITNKIKRISRMKQKLFNKARQSRKSTDWENFRLYQKESKKECKKAHDNYINKMVLDENTGKLNVKKLFGLIKDSKSDSNGVSSLRKDGKLYSDPGVKATILNDQFTSVFTTGETTTNLPQLTTNPLPSIEDIHITTQGVLNLLQNQNTNKATGPDGLSAHFLKSAASSIAPLLAYFFELTLRQGILPNDWRTAHVSPIFKKGDRSLASNYRPVSLTSICCKIMEHILFKHIIQHLQTNNVLSDAQHGFQRRRSTETQLLLCIHDFVTGIDNCHQTDAILLDFSKAFDVVPHRRLLHKLEHYGIRGNLHNWISHFLRNRTQRVVIEGHSSSVVPVSSGVPQGSVLGPLLFLVYINDLPTVVSSTSRLFADDSLVYRITNTVKEQQHLQNDLNKLQIWESDWLMKFHPEKCEVLQVGLKKVKLPSIYKIHDKALNSVSSAKYLGVQVNSKLDWNDHINMIIKKANSTLAFLRRNLNNCPTEVKSTSYKTMVRPILEYASTVWCPHKLSHINNLEKVQRRAARFCTGDYRRMSSVTEMLKDLNWPPLQTRRENATLIMLYKIIHNLVDIPCNEYLTLSNSRTRGHAHRLQVQHSRTNIHQKSFFQRGISLWNNLPDAAVSSKSLDEFKSQILSF